VCYIKSCEIKRNQWFYELKTERLALFNVSGPDLPPERLKKPEMHPVMSDRLDRGYGNGDIVVAFDISW